MADEMYCMTCEETVPVNRISRDGNMELACMNCGFVIDVAKGKVNASKAKAEPEAPKAEAPKPKPRRTFDCILIADDSEFIRTLLKTLLVQRHLAKTVMAVDNGQAVVGEFTRQLVDGHAPDLVILDLEMPVLDGLPAAKILRSVEAKFRDAKTPILFFTAHQCDDELKRQFELFAPASYVSKGSDGDPAQLIDRIEQVVDQL